MVRLDRVQGIDRLSFDSFTEALDYSREHAYDYPSNSAVSKGRGYGGHSGSDTDSYEHADTLARKGWKLGRETLARFESKIDVCSKVHKPEIQFDVTGDSGWDMGRVMDGIPESAMDWRDTEVKLDSPTGPIIKVVINCSMASNVDTEAIYRRGAAVLALIDALETSGKRVELEVAKINEGFYISIPLKSADMPLQLDEVAFALCHPAMNRRIGFALAYKCGMAGRRAVEDGSYGSGTSWKPDCDLYLPRLDYNVAWDSDESAIAWLKQTLITFGVVIED